MTDTNNLELASQLETGNNLVFVDTSIDSYQSIATEVNGADVILLDSSRDGIEQISEALSNYSGLDSVHLFSHGNNGLLQIGSSELSTSNLATYSDELRQWSDSLSTESDFFVYGCNLASDSVGLGFVEEFSSLTGADVAASNNVTGDSNLGGDWNLEVTVGNIESNSFALSDYDSTLATYDSGRYSFNSDNFSWQELRAETLSLGNNVNSITDFTQQQWLESDFDFTFDFDFSSSDSFGQQITTNSFGGAGNFFSSFRNFSEEFSFNGFENIRDFFGNIPKFTDFRSIEVVEIDDTNFSSPELLETTPALESSETTDSVEIAEVLELPEIPETVTTSEFVESINTQEITDPTETAEAAEFAEALELPELPETTTTSEVAEGGEINEISEPTEPLELEEASDTPELIEIPESIEDAETLEISEPVQPLELTEASETLELIETPESIEDIESLETSEPTELVEDVATLETSEPVELAEAPDTPELIETPESIEVTETPEISEPIELAEASDTPEIVDTPELVEDVATLETSEPVELVEASETPEIVDTPEPIEDSETLEVSEPIELAEASDTPEIIETSSNGEAGVVGLETNLIQVDEAAGAAQVTIVRTQGSTGEVSVDFRTVDAAATAGQDFTSASGTVTFADGETSQTINIPIADDALEEGTEDLSFTIDNVTGGATLLVPRTARVEILDNDQPASIEPPEILDENSPPTSPDLPPVNDETIISGLNQPTAIEWTPNADRFFIAEKGGVIKVAQDGAVSDTPFIDLSDQVNEARDRGLLDIAIHPDFFNGSPYVYALYTYDPPEVLENTGLAGADGSGNRAARLTRITADPATNFTTAVPGSEVVILGTNSTWENFNGFVNSTNDLDEAPAGILPDGTNLRDFLAADSESHTIGSVEFGPDGALYISNGDGTAFNQVDPRTIRVQDVDNLSGKILRIDPITGEGLADNPFFDGDANSNRSKVYQLGLRNPFRITVDPRNGEVFVGDVGWTQWEEINSAGAGANFGWPYYEGGNGVNLETGGYRDLAEAQAFYGSEADNATPALLGLGHGTEGENGIGSTRLF